MKRPTPDQWMGMGLAVMAALVLSLSFIEMGEGCAALRPLRPGDTMPALAVRSLEGEPVTLAAGQTGGEVLLVDFWATWCAPCVAEMPILQRIHERYREQGLELIAVNTDDARSPSDQARLVRRFLEEHGLDVPVVLDHGPAQATFRVQMLPTLVVVGRDGVVTKIYTGLTDERTLEREVLRALKPDR